MTHWQFVQRVLRSDQWSASHWPSNLELGFFRLSGAHQNINQNPSFPHHGKHYLWLSSRPRLFMFVQQILTLPKLKVICLWQRLMKNIWPARRFMKISFNWEDYKIKNHNFEQVLSRICDSFCLWSIFEEMILWRKKAFQNICNLRGPFK